MRMANKQNGLWLVFVDWDKGGSVPPIRHSLSKGWYMQQGPLGRQGRGCEICHNFVIGRIGQRCSGADIGPHGIDKFLVMGTRTLIMQFRQEWIHGLGMRHAFFVQDGSGSDTTNSKSIGVGRRNRRQIHNWISSSSSDSSIGGAAFWRFYSCFGSLPKWGGDERGCHITIMSSMIIRDGVILFDLIGRQKRRGIKATQKPPTRRKTPCLLQRPRVVIHQGVS